MSTLDEFLAVEVMGRESVSVDYSGTEWESKWQVENKAWMDKVDLVSVGEYYVNVPQDFYIVQADWSPSTNIEQAMMCLDTFEEWRIDHHAKSRGGYYEVLLPNGHISAGVDQSLPLAISLACAKAKGYTE